MRCFSHDLLNSIQEKEEELLESFFFHQNGTRKLLLAIWFEKLEYLYARMNIPQLTDALTHQLCISVIFTCSMIFALLAFQTKNHSTFYKICPSIMRISTMHCSGKNLFFFSIDSLPTVPSSRPFYIYKTICQKGNIH